ncbi:hypothetical protein VP01_972g3 [Puccinia sorghi]|uniref:Uncharacterized protein n=1 Tax=Puccinia sorghi TaxID=27349 RepID=A0A0L6U6F5_9BASI|nr:hypothetical protein VP01_972g3 [Puccinia sorghi]
MVDVAFWEVHSWYILDSQEFSKFLSPAQCIASPSDVCSTALNSLWFIFVSHLSWYDLHTLNSSSSIYHILCGMAFYKMKCETFCGILKFLKIIIIFLFSFYNKLPRPLNEKFLGHCQFISQINHYHSNNTLVTKPSTVHTYFTTNTTHTTSKNNPINSIPYTFQFCWYQCVSRLFHITKNTSFWLKFLNSLHLSQPKSLILFTHSLVVIIPYKTTFLVTITAKNNLLNCLQLTCSAPAKLPSKLHMFAYVYFFGTVTVHTDIIFNPLDKAQTKHRYMVNLLVNCSKAKASNLNFPVWDFSWFLTKGYGFVRNNFSSHWHCNYPNFQNLSILFPPHPASCPCCLINLRRLSHDQRRFLWSGIGREKAKHVGLHHCDCVSKGVNEANGIHAVARRMIIGCCICPTRLFHLQILQRDRKVANRKSKCRRGRRHRGKRRRGRSRRSRRHKGTHRRGNRPTDQIAWRWRWFGSGRRLGERQPLPRWRERPCNKQWYLRDKAWKRRCHCRSSSHRRCPGRLTGGKSKGSEKQGSNHLEIKGKRPTVATGCHLCRRMFLASHSFQRGQTPTTQDRTTRCKRVGNPRPTSHEQKSKDRPNYATLILRPHSHLHERRARAHGIAMSLSRAASLLEPIAARKPDQADHLGLLKLWAKPWIQEPVCRESNHPTELILLIWTRRLTELRTSPSANTDIDPERQTLTKSRAPTFFFFFWGGGGFFDGQEAWSQTPKNVPKPNRIFRRHFKKQGLAYPSILFQFQLFHSSFLSLGYLLLDLTDIITKKKKSVVCFLLSHLTCLNSKAPLSCSLFKFIYFYSILSQPHFYLLMDAKDTKEDEGLVKKSTGSFTTKKTCSTLQLTFSKLQPSSTCLHIMHSECAVCTVTVHQSLVESILENGWSNNRSFLGHSAFQLQAVEQVFLVAVLYMYRAYHEGDPIISLILKSTKLKPRTPEPINPRSLFLSSEQTLTKIKNAFYKSFLRPLNFSQYLVDALSPKSHVSLPINNHHPSSLSITHNHTYLIKTITVSFKLWQTNTKTFFQNKNWYCFVAFLAAEEVKLHIKITRTKEKDIRKELNSIKTDSYGKLRVRVRGQIISHQFEIEKENKEIRIDNRIDKSDSGSVSEFFLEVNSSGVKKENEELISFHRECCQISTKLLPTLTFSAYVNFSYTKIVRKNERGFYFNYKFLQFFGIYKMSQVFVSLLSVKICYQHIFQSLLFLTFHNHCNRHQRLNKNYIPLHKMLLRILRIVLPKMQGQDDQTLKQIYSLNNMPSIPPCQDTLGSFAPGPGTQSIFLIHTSSSLVFLSPRACCCFPFSSRYLLTTKVISSYLQILKYLQYTNYHINYPQFFYLGSVEVQGINNRNNILIISYNVNIIRRTFLIINFHCSYYKNTQNLSKTYKKILKLKIISFIIFLQISLALLARGILFLASRWLTITPQTSLPSSVLSSCPSHCPSSSYFSGLFASNCWLFHIMFSSFFIICFLEANIFWFTLIETLLLTRNYSLLTPFLQYCNSVINLLLHPQNYTQWPVSWGFRGRGCKSVWPICVKNHTTISTIILRNSSEIPQAAIRNSKWPIKSLWFSLEKFSGHLQHIRHFISWIILYIYHHSKFHCLLNIFYTLKRFHVCYQQEESTGFPSLFYVEKSLKVLLKLLSFLNCPDRKRNYTFLQKIIPSLRAQLIACKNLLSIIELSLLILQAHNGLNFFNSNLAGQKLWLSLGLACAIWSQYLLYSSQRIELITWSLLFMHNPLTIGTITRQNTNSTCTHCLVRYNGTTFYLARKCVHISSTFGLVNVREKKLLFSSCSTHQICFDHHLIPQLFHPLQPSNKKCMLKCFFHRIALLVNSVFKKLGMEAPPPPKFKKPFVRNFPSSHTLMERRKGENEDEKASKEKNLYLSWRMQRNLMIILIVMIFSSLTKNVYTKG